MNKYSINFGLLILKRKNSLLFLMFLSSIFGCRNQPKIEERIVKFSEFGMNSDLPSTNPIELKYSDSSNYSRGTVQYNNVLTPFLLETKEDSIFVTDDIRKRELIYLLKDSTQVLNLDNKAGPLPIFPYSSKFGGVKNINIKGKELQIQKIYINRNLNSESFNIAYFLNDFGFICIHRFYRHSFFMPVKCINTKYDIPEIKRIVLELQKDTVFYETEHFIPPTVLQE